VTWYEAESLLHWLNEQLHLPPGTIPCRPKPNGSGPHEDPRADGYPWAMMEAWAATAVESGINRTVQSAVFRVAQRLLVERDFAWYRSLTRSGRQCLGWTASEYTRIILVQTNRCFKRNSGGRVCCCGSARGATKRCGSRGCALQGRHRAAWDVTGVFAWPGNLPFDL